MENNLEFTWYMTEEDWKELRENYVNKIVKKDKDEYGTFICGKMAFTVYYNPNGESSEPYINMLVYGLNGSNSYLDSHNSVPVNQIANGFTVPIKQKNFEAFKRGIEKQIAKEIRKNKVWLSWSKATFGWKQYLEDYPTWKKIIDLTYREIEFNSYLKIYKAGIINTIEENKADKKIRLYCEGILRAVDDMTNTIDTLYTN